MRVLWTLVKVVFALAVLIPVSIVVLATALGVFGALLGLAILALKLAVIGLVGWGLFRLIARLLFGAAPPPRPKEIAAPGAVDPHYEAAMRELDQELGDARR